MTRLGLARRLAIALVMITGVGVAVAAGAKEDDSKEQKVSIKDLKYNPGSITIKSGQTVVWTNNDDKDHTVIGDTDKKFKSENLGPGDKYTYTFSKSGKFPYHCKYHPRMKGTVIVQD
jgi:plastocyanin